MPEISPHAIVSPGADLAEDVRVGPFSFIGPEVRLAAGCVVESNATVTGHTVLGERNHVYPLAVVGADPDGEELPGRCIIGNGNVFREHVTVYASGGEPTRIGEQNLVMVGSVIGPGACLGSHGIFPNFTRIGSGACIEDYVRTSGFSTISAGVRIGEYSFAAGYAEVSRNAPPYAMVWDHPFQIRGINLENLKRCGFTDEDIRSLKSAFRELFNGGAGLPHPDALDRLRARDDLNPHVRRLVDYLDAHPMSSESWYG
jgi:UDP-N-acetylglucosamine acyltransferase